MRLEFDADEWQYDMCVEFEHYSHADVYAWCMHPDEQSGYDYYDWYYGDTSGLQDWRKG